MADRKRIEGEWAVFSIAVESEVLDCKSADQEEKVEHTRTNYSIYFPWPRIPVYFLNKPIVPQGCQRMMYRSEAYSEMFCWLNFLE